MCTPLHFWWLQVRQDYEQQLQQLRQSQEQQQQQQPEPGPDLAAAVEAAVAEAKAAAAAEADEQMEDLLACLGARAEWESKEGREGVAGLHPVLLASQAWTAVWLYSDMVVECV